MHHTLKTLKIVICSIFAMKYWATSISLLTYLRFIECQKIEIENAIEMEYRPTYPLQRNRFSSNR